MHSNYIKLGIIIAMMFFCSSCVAAAAGIVYGMAGAGTGLAIANPTTIDPNNIVYQKNVQVNSIEIKPATIKKGEDALILYSYSTQDEGLTTLTIYFNIIQKNRIKGHHKIKETRQKGNFQEVISLSKIIKNDRILERGNYRLQFTIFAEKEKVVKEDRSKYCDIVIE